MKLDPLLAHEARIASLEAKLTKALARIAKLEAKGQRPKAAPIMSPEERAARIRMGQIAKDVAYRYGVTVERIKAHDRRPVFNAPRWETWDRCHRLGFSTPMIGRFFGNRNHTTILHGLERWKEMSVGCQLSE